LSFRIKSNRNEKACGTKSYFSQKILFETKSTIWNEISLRNKKGMPTGMKIYTLKRNYLESKFTLENTSVKTAENGKDPLCEQM
jgi:hypothetical protein